MGPSCLRGANGNRNKVLRGQSKRKDDYNNTQYLDSVEKAFHDADMQVDPPMLALPFIEQNVGIIA
jgi:hypothetical protein